MSPDPWNSKQDSKAPSGSRLGLYLWIGFLVVGALCLWELGKLFPRERSDGDTVYLIQGVAILAVLSSSIIFVRKFNFPEIARNIALWVCIFAVFALGYVYQDDLKEAGTRIMSEIVPGYAVTNSAGEMVLTESGGHFFVTGTAGDVPIVFLIDTGASDIVISPADARRIGLDPATLDYSRRAMTANGEVRGARATLERLKVNKMEITDVPVTINQAEMDSSLLGMAFLKRLKSYEVRGRQLYLRW